jgi:hypothetical protein
MEILVLKMFVAFGAVFSLAISEIWRSRYDKLMDEFEAYKLEKE